MKGRGDLASGLGQRPDLVRGAGPPPRLRILMLAYEFPESIDEAIVSGEVKNPYHLARRLIRRGHDVAVVSVPFLTRTVTEPVRRPGGAPTIHDVPEGRGRAAARYLWRIVNVARFLRSELLAWPPDLIHAQSPALALAAQMAVSKAPRGTPIVTTAHGTYVPEVRGDRVRRTPREVARETSYRLLLPLDRAAFQRSSAVVSVSEFQRTEMEQLYRVPRRRSHVIYNGIDTTLFSADPSEDGPQAGNSRARTRVLFVGRLVPKKGLQNLILAMPSIVASVPNAELVVVGGSPQFDTYGAELRRLAARVGVADRISWLQSVAERTLPALYREATVCVVPSVNYESLPTVALEAMSCGTAVVASDAWGTPEALGRHHPGLVPQGDTSAIAHAVVRFVRDQSLRETVVRHQTERIGRFDLDRTVQDHEELYATALASQSRD